MDKQLQDQLAAMTFEEFKVWHAIHSNADKLPLFRNSRWLADQAILGHDPVREIYDAMLVWAKKYPL